MKKCLPLNTDFQSMYFLSTRFLKDKMNEVFVPLFQLAYIFETTHNQQTNLVKLCCEGHYMW